MTSNFHRERKNGRRTSAQRSLWKLTHLEDRVVPANQLLPDLHVLQANLTGWTVTPGVQIRFSTGMANGGQGPFELNGTTTIINNPDGTQSQVVNQKIYWDDGTTTSRVAGTFTYHSTHGHTHFDDFAIARLRIRPTDQSVGAVVATGPKTSFCLIDINHYDPSLPGSPANGVYGCSTTKQGISVGWNDVYGSGLDGQFINIAGVPNGDYWLEVEADPANHILENNETNNVTRVPVSLTAQPYVGFAIASSQPLGASNNPVSSVDLTFNSAVDPTTITPADMTFSGPNGPITITGVTQVSTTQFRVEFANQTTIGTYTMTIGPNISSSTGKLMDQNNNGTPGETQDAYFNIFTITAPNIGMVTPTGTVAAPVSTVRVTYNRPMDSTTFTIADVVSFKGPSGADLLSSITAVTPVLPGGSSQGFDIAFTAVSTPGVYTMVIGSDVRDTVGNLVDQNNDGVPNTPADQYTNTFILPIPGTYGPDGFGYTAQGIALQTVDMNGATALTFPNSSDDDSSAVNLGGDTFNFYGTTYNGATSLYASTNGLITFGSGVTTYNNTDLSSPAQPAIAPLWDDWIIGSGTPQARFVRRDTNADGKNDQLIIEWNQEYHYQSSTNPVTFQAILELNTGARPGKIIFNYPDITTSTAGDSNGASATVGVRSNSTTNYKLLVSQNSSSHPLIATGKAVLVSVPQVVSITREDASPAPDGDVHYHVVFSDPIAALNTSDFKITTTGTLAGAKVHGIEGTADPKVWEVHLDTGYGNGTLRLDFADNDTVISAAGAKVGGLGIGNGDFTSGEVYTIVQQPPRVQGVNIGDGTSQRSRLNLLHVVFTKIVDFAGNLADSFQLVGPNGSISVNVDLSLTTPVETVAKLTFSGPNTDNGWLKDGKYTLTIPGGTVSTGGVLLDGDSNGQAGGNYSMQFHRLFGDGNGDGQVSAVDFNMFRAYYGSNAPGNMFDFDGDNLVNAADFAAFRGNYGITLIP